MANFDVIVKSTDLVLMAWRVAWRDDDLRAHREAAGQLWHRCR